jgi:hypothetical protein
VEIKNLISFARPNPRRENETGANLVFRAKETNQNIKSPILAPCLAYEFWSKQPAQLASLM